MFCQQLLPGKKREQLGIFYKAGCVYVWQIQRETLDEWVRPKWLNAFHELSISKHCLTQRAAGLENASWKSLFFSSPSAFYNPHDSHACFPLFSHLYCHFFIFFHLNRADAPYLPPSSFTSAPLFHPNILYSLFRFNNITSAFPSLILLLSCRLLLTSTTQVCMHTHCQVPDLRKPLYLIIIIMCMC